MAGEGGEDLRLDRNREEPDLGFHLVYLHILPIEWPFGGCNCSFFKQNMEYTWTCVSVFSFTRGSQPVRLRWWLVAGSKESAGASFQSLKYHSVQLFSSGSHQFFHVLTL